MHPAYPAYLSPSHVPRAPCHALPPSIMQLGAMTHGRFAFAHPPSAANLKLLGKGQGGGPATNNEFWKEPTTAVPFQYVLYGDYMPMSFRCSTAWGTWNLGA